jgi:hypothetical protein
MTTIEYLPEVRRRGARVPAFSARHLVADARGADELCASAPDADRRAWPTLRRQKREEPLCAAPCPPVISSAAPERDCAALRDFSAPA